MYQAVRFLLFAPRQVKGPEPSRVEPLALLTHLELAGCLAGLGTWKQTSGLTVTEHTDSVATSGLPWSWVSAPTEGLRVRVRAWVRV